MAMETPISIAKIPAVVCCPGQGGCTLHAKRPQHDQIEEQNCGETQLLKQQDLRIQILRLLIGKKLPRHSCYPLAMTNITMESQHFYWKNSP